jgi:hypothetical protein
MTAERRDDQRFGPISCRIFELTLGTPTNPERPLFVHDSAGEP